MEDKISYLLFTCRKCLYIIPDFVIYIRSSVLVYSESWLKSKTDTARWKYLLSAIDYSNYLAILLFSRTANTNNSISELFLTAESQPSAINLSCPVSTSEHTLLEMQYSNHSGRTELLSLRTT